MDNKDGFDNPDPDELATDSTVPVYGSPGHMSDIGERMSNKTQKTKDKWHFHLNVDLPKGPEKFCSLDRDRNHWVQPDEVRFLYQEVVPKYLHINTGKRKNFILPALLMFWKWKEARMGEVHKFPLDQDKLLLERVEWSDKKMLFFLRWLGVRRHLSSAYTHI
jgi:hypothetical protein